MISYSKEDPFFGISLNFFENCEEEKGKELICLIECYEIMVCDILKVQNSLPKERDKWTKENYETYFLSMKVQRKALNDIMSFINQ